MFHKIFKILLLMLDLHFSCVVSLNLRGVAAMVEPGYTEFDQCWQDALHQKYDALYEMLSARIKAQDHLPIFTSKKT